MARVVTKSEVKETMGVSSGFVWIVDSRVGPMVVRLQDRACRNLIRSEHIVAPFLTCSRRLQWITHLDVHLAARYPAESAWSRCQRADTLVVECKRPVVGTNSLPISDHPELWQM